MPNFDGGHYFLTALVPLKTEPVRDGHGVFTSPVHALRKLLAQLPANPTLRFFTPPSPFANVPGLHFLRLVIVDDVAYNGRVGANAILSRIKGKFNPAAGDPMIAQRQDHVKRPYVMLAMDFDAADGRDISRDTFLRAMWNVLPKEIGEVLQYAVGFDRIHHDANGFATYISACQIETTMSFNDYYIDPPGLQDWTSKTEGKAAKIAAIVSLVALVIGVLDLLAGFVWPHLLAYGGAFVLLGLLILIGAAVFAAVTISRQGDQAFPTDPRTTLPNILKALYLQRAFTDFATANQANAARDTGEAALHAAFGTFLASHKPDQLAGPTQPPSVLGI